MFNLSLNLNRVRLDQIKADLTKALPQVKSSHRVEAIARGLGFNTHAAAIAATATGNSVLVNVDGGYFSAFLTERNVSIPTKPFYIAGARAALAEVGEKHEKLTAFGMGIGRPNRGQNGKGETWREFEQRFVTDRAMLFDSHSAEPFLASLALLGRVQATKTVRPGTGSYRLKHVAENFHCVYPDGTSLGPIYVANGIFIAAAIHAGFTHKTYDDGYGFVAVNVSFNMSKQCLDELDIEIRPDGARASERNRKKETREFLKFQRSYA